VAGDINSSGNIRFQGNRVLGVDNGNNTTLGIGTLTANTSGSGNTASGTQALTNNTSGSGNRASGSFALKNNTTGLGNTVSGYSALFSNTTGNYNTASGFLAMYNNITGSKNTASGYDALLSNTTGIYNTASGYQALFSNTTGNNNIAIGYYAALNVSSGNSNNIHIGSQGSGADSSTIRIGEPTMQSSFFAAGVRGVTTANNNAIPVVIDSSGQLGTISSSRRFKEDIQDMGDASLMRLRPVTFRYQKPFADGSQPIQYGLIAEEVAEVYPDLVAHSADGQIETVKYQVLDAMLLNEVQRQQRMIEKQQHEIEALKAQVKEFSVLQARLVALENAVAGNR
jgi:hypothetical protein